MKKDSKNRQRIQNVRARTRTLIVVAAIAAMICCTVVAVFAATTAQTAEPTYIYFDLAAGNVTITGTRYEGCAYKKTSSGYTVEPITGDIKAGEAYYVYQSKGGSNNPDGYFTEENGVKTFTLPKRNSVTYLNKSWGEYITNNSNVEEVITNWEEAAQTAERESTTHRICVTGAVGNATIVIDNLWSSYHNGNKARTDGGISFYPNASTDSHLIIKTKGDNRFGNVFYSNYNSASGKVSITFDEYTSGSSLTVADFSDNKSANYWDSAIGGSDATVENADGIIFEGGTVFAGTTKEDDCTAIGGGGNGYGGITINGGNVTAVVTSSGAAIGGGIGKSSAGGAAKVTITGGNVYAYNFSCESTSGGYQYSDTNTKYIPSAAIGGGSSGKNTCNSCTVNITGGYVYAQSVGGTAIGGGSSADTHGGSAAVTISGNAKVVARSIEGEIGGQTVLAGAAIGGGTGGAKAGSNGGNVTLTIEESAEVIAGSIGGGKTNSTSGKIGSANVTMKGGTLQGQIVMAKGSSSKCSFTMSGGTIDNSQHNDNEFVFLQSDGGAIWMDDGNGTVTLSGGTITGCSATNGNGGAVYMTAGTFNMNGGTISSCTATNGGAVYMEGGTFNMSGGEISSCTATDGAGVYLKSGNLTVSNGKITNNTASQNGGGAYLGGGALTVSGGEITQNTASQNGGAFAVFNGNYTMTGGKVSQNKATNGYGGAVYVSSTQNSEVLIRSGEVTSNTAGLSGGALGIQSQGTAQFTVTVGSNTSHEGKSNCHVCKDDQSKEESCPIIKENTATQSGGGIYLAGTTSATLNIYCIQEKDNKADGGTSLSNFMKVEGGTLKITTGTNGSEGNVIINSTIYVTDGQVTVAGITSNPMFKESVTVDVQNQSQFNDIRTGDKAYTIQYFENFTQNGITSGQYTMIDVNAETNHTVKASMYSHTGYDIDGWNLKENETLYKANENITVNKHLYFYAKWSVVGYTVQFEPGVDKYQGSMTSQSFKYDEKKELNKNLYINIGYDFVHWKDKNGNTYKDGAEVERLSSTHGEIIVLTAQWEICKHNDDNYTVTATGNTATRECHCKGYSETVTITGWSGTYDGSAHPATVTYQYNSLNGVSATNQWKETDFSIIYSGKDNAGDSYNAEPVNAGTCTAKIQVTNEVSISAQITINRATRKDLPNAPTYKETTDESNDRVTITVTGPAETEEAPLEFRFSWYEGTELKSNKGLDENWEMKKNENFPSHTLEKTYTNYYVEVRYKQTCNYEASDPVRSATSVVWTGNVTFNFSVGPGLYCYFSGSPDKTAEGITVTLTPKDGYYIYKIKSDMTTSGQEDYGNPTLTNQTTTSTEWTVKITDIKEATNSVTITITFSGAEKKAIVNSALVKDEVFEDIAAKGESSVTVSRDSAFTVQFTVDNFNYYKEPKIKFGTALPKGSTVIMLDRTDNSYWSYAVGESGASEIALTAFTRMGNNSYYSLTSKDSLNLQFVIDFSDCDESNWSASSLSVNLTATPEQPSSDLKTVPDFPQESKSVTLAVSPTFSVSVSQDKDGLSSSLTYQFAVVSEGVGTSKWDARRGILCLTPESSTSLPADARLQVKVGDSTAIYPLIDGKFTVSLPTNGSAIAELTLLSDMLPNETVKMEFDVMLYSSETWVGTAPSTTKITNPTTVTYSVTETKKYAVCAEIDGALPRYNTDGTITELKFKGSVSSELPENYKVQASLYSKNGNGEYTDTTVPATVKIDGESLTGSCSFGSLGGDMKNMTGSLSMMLKFELIDPNGSTVDSMPLYFILIDERQ